MTRPIYEPSLTRTDRALGFGNDQLFRRPAPQGGDSVIPVFTGWRTSNVTMVSGTETNLNWQFWNIEDTTVFDTDNSGGEAIAVYCLLDGWYSINVWINFTSIPASGFAGIMMIHDDTDIFEPAAVMGVTFPTNFSLDVVPTFQIVRYFPPLFQTQEPPSFAWADRLKFRAVQNAGVNRTLTQAYCNIGYLGPGDVGQQHS
jgi:hypothetical protein